jgi:predicted ATPase
MLTQLRIQNFKSWRDTGQMRFAPLTGFFGPNSSGKTSILQFLLMLKQTVESNQRTQVLELGNNPTGKNFYVNLGTFTDITFQKEVPGKISFEITWSTVDNHHYDLGDRTKEFNAPETISFTADIDQDNDYVPRISYFAYKSKQFQAGVKRREHPNTQNQYYELLLHANSINYTPDDLDSFFVDTVYKFYGFPSNIQGVLIAESADLNYLNSAFEDFFYKIRYLGPVRIEPVRIYFWSGSAVDDLGSHGEQTIQALLHASRTNKNPIDYVNGVQTDTEVHVAKWLTQLNLIHSFELRPIAEGRPEYEVRIRQTENSPEVLLTEVGFGISQVLPVLTLCYYVPEGSTIILEQPEIHLHPAVQAGLADVFIDVIKNRGVQIILESHSEHLLNRLQRRMAEEQLVPEDIALYFTRMENGESKLEELKIDEYGSISNWPENFFGDEMGDLVAMAEAAMKRQLQQQANHA